MTRAELSSVVLGVPKLWDARRSVLLVVSGRGLVISNCSLAS
jgi:hypothetical protein